MSLSASSSGSDCIKPKPVAKDKGKSVVSGSFSYEPSPHTFAASMTQAQIKTQRHRKLELLKEKQMQLAREMYGPTPQKLQEATSSSYLPSPVDSGHEAISIKSSSSSSSRSSRKKNAARASSIRSSSRASSRSIKSEQTSSTLVAYSRPSNSSDEDEVPLAVQLKTIRTERRPQPPLSSSSTIKSNAHIYNMVAPPLVRGVPVVKKKKSLFEKFIDIFLRDEDCIPSSKSDKSVLITNAEPSLTDFDTISRSVPSKPLIESTLQQVHSDDAILAPTTLSVDPKQTSIFDPKMLQEMEIDDHFAEFTHIIEKYSSSPERPFYNPHPDATRSNQRRTAELKPKARTKADLDGVIDADHARLAELLLESMRF